MSPSLKILDYRNFIIRDQDYDAEVQIDHLPPEHSLADIITKSFDSHHFVSRVIIL